MFEDAVSPKFLAKRPNREAMELLKLQESPSILRDSTPPHLNTRSRRGKPASVTWKKPSDENEPPEGRIEDFLAEIKQEYPGENPITPATPPRRGRPEHKSPLKDAKFKANSPDGVEMREPDVGAVATPDSVPQTPHLNTALIETPRVDFTPRALRRKPYLQDDFNKKEGYEPEILDHHAPFDPAAFESTKVTTGLASDESSYARPPKWSLRQLSPIRNIEDAEMKSELTSSFVEDETFAVENAGVQVSLCQKCHTHSAWSEMKPIVMIFTFLMLSLLYRGLLRVDPRLAEGAGDALGATVQGTFLASYNLEEYIANFFGA